MAVDLKLNPVVFPLDEAVVAVIGRRFRTSTGLGAVGDDVEFFPWGDFEIAEDGLVVDFDLCEDETLFPIPALLCSLQIFLAADKDSLKVFVIPSFSPICITASFFAFPYHSIALGRSPKNSHSTPKL